MASRSFTARAGLAALRTGPEPSTRLFLPPAKLPHDSREGGLNLRQFFCALSVICDFYSTNVKLEYSQEDSAMTKSNIHKLRRRPMALALSALLLSGLINQYAAAQSFPAVINLSSLNGSNGFRVDGVATDDLSGHSVSSAGDINGDGLGDLIIGTSSAGPNGPQSACSYVVFGKATPFAATLGLSSLDGTNGFSLDSLTNDFCGYSVSAAGDINGDGRDDLIIGAFGASLNGSYSSGSSYVVFGKASPFAAALALSSLDGMNGFRLDGTGVLDRAGFSVSAAGDINGDGRDDLVVGATTADFNGSQSGSSYVVFGKATPFAATLALASLDGTSGFRIDGVADDRAGRSVSAAGDINDDGRDDLIIGAPNGANGPGSSYVVFGKAAPFAATLVLSNLNGTNGFRLDGEVTFDYSGSSVSGAGDINGDGRDDLIIGARGAIANGMGTGRSFVVFGQTTPFPAIFALSSLNGSNGFRLDGIDVGDNLGASVSAAGDINGDGLDDLIVGARFADPNGFNSGSSYVVFGNATPFAATLALSSLDGTSGFRLDGAADDRAGTSVSAAGDVNGDGRDDLIIGAPGSNVVPVGAGRSYVLFGRDAGAIFKNGFE